jgi:thymidine kinase
VLAFHFGVMGSGKSAFALMTAHEKNRPDAASHPNRAVLATTMDRSTDTVTSRTGMTAQAIQLLPGTVRPELFNGANTVVIDEAQFLTTGDVDVLAGMSAAGTEVICFGLRTDFSSALFEGARRLLELADKVAPMAIEPRCAACERPAVINARFIDGRLTATGDTVVIGDVARAGSNQKVTYDPMCYRCWRVRLGDAATNNGGGVAAAQAIGNDVAR